MQRTAQKVSRTEDASDINTRRLGLFGSAMYLVICIGQVRGLLPTIS